MNFITRKKVKFLWDDKCQESFEKLKANLAPSKLLQYPYFEKKFIITVEEFKIGCGAVLSQDFNGSDLYICYILHLKLLTLQNRKKPIIDLELLAIHFAIKQFRPYVYGTEFTVRSDHRLLVHLFNMKDPSFKLTRIRLDLSEYYFTIEYIKGKSNIAADALSRITRNELKNTNQVFAVTTRAMSKQTFEQQRNTTIRQIFT